MKRGVFFLLSLCLLETVHAQVQPPGITLDVTVSVAKPLAGLTFNSTEHVHQATFTLNANTSNAPAGTVLIYNWNTTDSSITFDNATASTSTARTTVTGRFFPSCTVTAFEVSMVNGLPVFTVKGTGQDARECVALGGPITTSIKPATVGSTVMYQHDQNQPSKPFYLTNYGYSHALPLPTGCQTTQNVQLDIPGQPQGSYHNNPISVVTWYLPEKTYSADSLNATSILVTAEDDFQDGVPIVKFSFDDGVVSGEVYDDSAETQDRKVLKNGGVAWVDHVYKISGHKPKELTDEMLVDGGSGFVSGAVKWTNIALYKYILKDTVGDPMPGVRVQERFTTPVAPAFKVNDRDKFWLTASAFDVKIPGMNAGDGWFNLPDKLSAYWTGIGPFSDFSYTHVYYAGNTDPTSTAGVNVGTYTMTFTVGTPGTAVQSKLP